ncbi:hypothetical protein, partial [Dyella flava]
LFFGPAKKSDSAFRPKAPQAMPQPTKCTAMRNTTTKEYKKIPSPPPNQAQSNSTNKKNGHPIKDGRSFPQR